MVEIEAAFVVDARELHLEAAVVGELEPRRDVAVMVELRADDLVTLAPFARCGTRQGEVQRRHVRAEDDLVDRRVEKGCGGRVARATSSSESRDVSNGPPRFAFASRR